MKKTLKEYQKEIGEKAEKVTAIFDLADEKQGGECTKEQIEQIKAFNKEIADLEQKAAETKEGDELRRTNENRREAAKTAARLPEPTGKEGRDGEPSARYNEARKSLGQLVLEDADFKAWHEKVAAGGRIANGTTIQTPNVQVKTLITGLSDTSAGAMVQTDYQPTINRAPFAPLVLRDLISVGTTGSDLLEYAIISGYVNNAATVAEATATTGASGTKPESAMTFDKVNESVRTIAHWIPATTRALADAGQLRSLIDTFLRFGLNERVEKLMLTGDGTGENFRGIFNTTGIQAQAYDTSVIVTARRARTKVKTPGRVTPTANQAAHYAPGVKSMSTNAFG